MLPLSSRNRHCLLLIKLNTEQYKSPSAYSTPFIHTNEGELLKLVVWIIYLVVGKITSGFRPPADFAHCCARYILAY